MGKHCLLKNETIERDALDGNGQPAWPVGVVTVDWPADSSISQYDQWLFMQKMEAVGTLAGGLAHDFNNLLSVIVSHATVAMFEIGRGRPGYETIKGMLAATDMAKKLTSQLLAFTRKESFDMQPLDINEIIRETLAMLRFSMPRDVALTLELNGGKGSICADATQIKQAIMNILLNCLDAMPEGGTLTIRTTDVCPNQKSSPGCCNPPPGRHCMIQICDTGTGMTDEVRKRIFEPLFTTKAAGKGTGLGMSVTYGIIQKHGGRIDVVSVPGKGSVFTIFLPQCEKC
jgi:signal transduction histidine kinase